MISECVCAPHVAAQPVHRPVRLISIILKRFAPLAEAEVRKPALRLCAPKSAPLSPSFVGVLLDDFADRLGGKPAIGDLAAFANRPKNQTFGDGGRGQPFQQGSSLPPRSEAGDFLERRACR
jgi:hypothetical protein